ncbi:MAG: PIG-L family deacetylase [Gammaproteobacteria bacterium]|nr:PIG-L family deacetylase [Gammaproteobacteria bacterium]MBU0788288.1 PIG-L family deacetylase [Gammaproteobacteria bacterium]MBU0815215.1 PIG-L family deacetylase [Gammaproteobacteria bacterium]MBU1785677.1 PIG-L family deacetylase [Gammaproteobacteria bacterium]
MKILVVAPHPDDELLGCGGTLLRRQAEGAEVGWLLVTAIAPGNGNGWGTDRIGLRRQEIEQVRQGLGVLPQHMFELGFPTTRLDELRATDLVNRFSQVFSDFQPDEVLLPHAHDIHSDHRIVFNAACACTKWFRYPSVKRVLSYETLSETDFVLKPEGVFLPTSYVDISLFMERKLALMRCYPSELGKHPFPRSETALRALAQLRGAQSGFEYSEAFQLLRERL